MFPLTNTPFACSIYTQERNIYFQDLVQKLCLLLFNDIYTLYGILNAEISFICACLIKIKTILSMFLWKDILEYLMAVLYKNSRNITRWLIFIRPTHQITKENVKKNNALNNITVLLGTHEDKWIKRPKKLTSNGFNIKLNHPYFEIELTDMVWCIFNSYLKQLRLIWNILRLTIIFHMQISLPGVHDYINPKIISSKHLCLKSGSHFVLQFWCSYYKRFVLLNSNEDNCRWSYTL